jgi:hypothetical protein
MVSPLDRGLDCRSGMGICENEKLTSSGMMNSVKWFLVKPTINGGKTSVNYLCFMVSG